MILTQSFTLDIVKPPLNRLRLVNGDTANQFVVTIKNNNAAVTLDSTLHKIIAVFTRADGEVYTQDASCGVTFTTTGVVTIDLRPASFRTGTNKLTLQIYKRENSSATEYPLLLTTQEQPFNARAAAIPEAGAPNAPSQLPMLERYVLAAKSYANGNTGTREGEDIDNAMYYKQLAEQAVQGGIIDPTFATWLTAHMSDFITAIGNNAAEWLSEHITNPSNPPLDTSLSLANAAAPANLLGFLVNYLGAAVYRSDKNTAAATYTAYIKASTSAVTPSTNSNQRVAVYPVEAGKLYVLYGQSVRLSSAQHIAVFSTSLFDGESALTADSVIVPSTTATVATDYNVIYRAPADGYIYIASYGAYGKLELYDGVYRSTTLDNISVSTKPSESYDVSFDDIFNKYESSYIDDFTARASFVDSDHPYTIIGSDADAPTITTGTGATRTGADGIAKVAYSRPINSFPYVCMIGRINGASQIIKLFDDTNDFTVSVITVAGSNGGVTYGGQSYGSIHVNSAYCVYVVNSDAVTIFDDAGVSVRIPVQYTSDKPCYIAMCFGANVGRVFGYGSFVEFVKRPMQRLDFYRCVAENEDASSQATVRDIIRFTHAIWNNGAVASFYTKPSANPYMEIVSGLSNNPCIKCICDYSEDNGYRTEMGITPIKGSLKGKLGGLQRYRASADYYMASADNPGISDYYTYIFQLHNSGFVVSGWTDAPPFVLRVKNNRLYAFVCYKTDGSVPTGDNVHVNDEYDLCEWSLDAWHHVDVEARIGWRDVLAPRLIVRVDGREVLNVTTPVGYNIVSSGGYVNTHFGCYCPEWHSGMYNTKHREILVTNIRWEGTQYVN